MSRKKKITIAAVSAAILVLLIAAVITAVCLLKPKPSEDGESKKPQTEDEQGIKEDEEEDEKGLIKNATTEVIELEDDGSNTGFEVEVGLFSYSHGMITDPIRYRGWEAQYISLKTNEIKDMEKKDKKMIITADSTEGEAFFASDGSSHPAENYDLMYVYTMPCKAKVDIVMTVKVTGGSTDGVIAYAYRNNTSNCIINGTKVTGSKALQANDVILEKGDKIYFRYNKNESSQNDDGNFYIKLTYKELDPGGAAFQGEPYELKVELPKAGTVSYSHGSIKNPDVYPFWSAVSISLADGKETAMVKDGGMLYIAGDSSKTAYFSSEPSSNTSDSYDLVYIYTMPCRGKVNISLTAGVTDTGGDGVVGYVYKNDTSNMLIDKTVFKAGTAKKAVHAQNVILEKGDKIYFRYNKNQSAQKDEGTFYARITWVEVDPKEGGSSENTGNNSDTTVKVEAGTISFSHGSINAPDTYPCWETKSINLSTNKISDMVDGSVTNTRYVQEDESAYLNVSGKSQSSQGHDLLYVYTMPCKAKIDIELHASVTGGDSDGIAVYAYRNSTDHCIFNHTEVTNTSNKTVGAAQGVIFEKGDKLYFRLNSNGTTKDDLGFFYVKLTYAEIGPEGDVFEGEAYKAPSESGGEDDGSSEPAVKVEAGTVSFSHGSINAPDTYPCWETKSINLSDGEMSDMVKGSVANTMYVQGDASAYLNVSGKAQSSQGHDLLYVYTMPCKAKLDIELHASVTGGDSDGIAVYAYRNSTDHCIFNHTEVTNTSNKTVGAAQGVIFEKGDKLYFRLNSNGTTKDDLGFFYVKLTYVGIDPEGDAFEGEAYKAPAQGGDEDDGKVSAAEITVGTTTYANDYIKYPDVHPNWKAVSISMADSTENAMVTDAGKLYIDGDIGKTAYFASNGMAKGSEDNDLAYVYTMPCKAKIDIELMTMLAGTSGDGIVVSIYADEVENTIIKKTKITGDDRLQTLTADNIILEKGSKLYFRWNKNSSVTGDEGLFQAKITFTELEPKGDAYKKITWKDMVAAGAGSKGVYYSHGSINDSKTYPYFDKISISLKDGQETALVKGSVANTLYVANDESAYLNVKGYAQSALDYDLVYVYTMPCKAKINLSVNTSVTSSKSDGVVVHAYVNDASNSIFRKVVTSTKNSLAGTADGITLEEGDKLYIRLNKNETTTDDYGFFYAKITYVNEEPDEDVFQGKDLTATAAQSANIFWTSSVFLWMLYKFARGGIGRFSKKNSTDSIIMR